MKNQFKIQKTKSRIIIVGAGPAGASLAIRLAKRDFQVVLIEKERFPRHKLCGEFISPECLEHFRELGVLDEMLMSGGDRISETVFYSENGKSVSIPSQWFNENPKGALSLSRAEMDFQLMKKAKEVGIEVFQECSVVGVLFDGENVCGVNVRNAFGENKECFADLMVDATGRARILSKLVKKEISRRERKNKRSEAKSKLKHQTPITKTQKSSIKNRLVGFKVHLRNVNLEKGRCEIYFFRGGYGGLSYVENGIANHCFLIKADIVKEYKGNVQAILENVIFKNVRARETLGEAKTLFDWLAVSVDGFGVKELSTAKNLITVGDAAAFIDPFTGSGMLMAFESARILADVIMKHQHHSFEKMVADYQQMHSAKFQKRLRICSVMRRLSFAPNFAKLAINILNLSEKGREVLARSTRQAKTKNV